MAKRLSWSPNVLKCIAKIAEYIALDSEFYAKIFVRKVFDFGERLTLFPKSGRVVPEYADEPLREIIYGNYRIVYRLEPEVINILAVSNSAQILEI
jgi:plasmid stabilization system protein ParE